MEVARHTVCHHEYIPVSYDIRKYKEVIKYRWDPYKDEPIQNAAALCYIWRRIVNEDESRQLAILEIFEKHPRIIVFYNYDYELEILRTIFKSATIAEWNGHKHQPVPDSKSWVYLVNYASGAEAWNCITTDTIVFYSENYSYRIMEQASGRIDRMNTPYVDLYYYHLKSHAPIDLAISRSLRTKKTFNESRYVKRLSTPRQTS